MLQEVSSQRLDQRAKPTEDIWVYWLCDERGEASRIRDISLGGLFLESAKLWGVGSRAQVNFLVKEGQIQAQAIVKHIEPDFGLGLKFIMVRDADRVHLVDLIHRLGGASGERRMPVKVEQQRPLRVLRKIVGFHLDETREWVAELECGHQQQVRRNPPWKSPHWVTTATGRSFRIGTQVDCLPCGRAEGLY